MAECCCCLDLELQEDALTLDVADVALEWGSDEYVRVVNVTADEYDGPYDATPSSGYRDVPADALFRGRTAGTVTQGLWTAVVVDTSAETVNLVRFGAGPDRSYGYGVVVYHTVTATLSHVTSSNAATSIEDGTAYATTLTAESGYTLDTVTVTMGGTDITSTAYSGGVVSIASVTGDITVTAAASKPRVNQLPLATDKDGTIYNGTGYKPNTRLNSSGNPTAATGYYATGFIPVTAGQKVTFENMTLVADNSVSGWNYQYVSFYSSSKTLLASCSMYARDWVVNYGTTLINPYTLDGTNLTSITPHGTQGTRDLTNVAYMRVSAALIDSLSAIYVE